VAIICGRRPAPEQLFNTLWQTLISYGTARTMICARPAGEHWDVAHAKEKVGELRPAMPAA